MIFCMNQTLHQLIRLYTQITWNYFNQSLYYDYSFHSKHHLFLLFMQQTIQQKVDISEEPDTVKFDQKYYRPRVLTENYLEHQHEISNHIFPEQQWNKSKINPEKSLEGFEKSKVRQLKMVHQYKAEPKKMEEGAFSQKQLKKIMLRQRKKYALPPVQKGRKLPAKNRILDDMQEKIICNYINANIKNQLDMKPQHKKYLNYRSRNQSLNDISTDQLERYLKGQKRLEHLTVQRQNMSHLIERSRKKYRTKTMVNNYEDMQTQHETNNYLRLHSKSQALHGQNDHIYMIKKTKQYEFFELKTQFLREIENNVEGISVENEQYNKDDKDNPNLIKVPIIPAKQNIKAFINRYQPKNEDIHMKELIKSNFFTIQYSPQEIYFGEMVGKKKSGQGVFINQNLCYQGNWKNNQKIKGLQINSFGVYKGEFLEGRKEGDGQFQWANGEFYVGEWKKGKRQGNGLWVNKKGDSYNGNWKNGKGDGYGVFTFNKRKYKGQFLGFDKHGWGRQMFPNGDSFEGIYKEGKPHGKGLYRWANGTVFEGDFESGLRNGIGVLRSPFKLTYKGQFKFEQCEGECEIQMPNGDTYYGMFKNGKKNGKGTLKIKNQRKILNGYWKNDQFIQSMLV